ncbi:hypothetical protein [Actinopolyspora saharensis]|uniref:hypothetical protein n=1 Tax=Actinopolyspora saharensis TaxID=995062 RepID=UPI00111380BD|nr:hypothetical protein [Actinopolyspora saharensis]
MLSSRGGPRGRGFERIDYGLFPPSAECVWANGNTTDLVPDHVAPLLYAFLIAAAACALTAAHLARRNHREPPHRHDAPA